MGMTEFVILCFVGSAIFWVVQRVLDVTLTLLKLILNLAEFSIGFLLSGLSRLVSKAKQALSARSR